MKSFLILIPLIFLASSCVTKKVDGKTVYVQDNPVEEGAEVAIKYFTGANVDLSPSTTENHTIMGVELSHLLPEKRQGDEVVKVEKKTTITIEKKEDQQPS